LFREGRFQEAVELYSSAIDRKERLEFLDPRFFSNRASAYLRLRLFEEALEDAKVYISKRPKCCKGYARKALASHGLNDMMGAEFAAAQTYNLAREIFSKYDPFKKFSYLEKCTRFCYSGSDLLQALNTMPSCKRVLFLYPGTYEITRDAARQESHLIPGNIWNHARSRS
jgi:tetratricopeptide (TPR) repeat protein